MSSLPLAKIPRGARSCATSRQAAFVYENSGGACDRECGD